MSQASTAKQDDVDDSTLEDGGWGKAGPLIVDRQRASARRGHQRGMNSFDKTAVWLRTSQSGPTGTASEQVQVSLVYTFIH